MAKTMRALVGGVAPDWEAREVDVPSPGPGQVLVRVRAASLNRADLYMLEGTYNPSARTSFVYTAGLELAGEVAELGPGVGAFALGDRVMGAALGAFAPYALLDHRHLMAVPASMSWTDAAALPVGLSTEHDALVTQACLAAGDSVLIVGGSSSIGLLGIQVAKTLGASRVIATTTSEGKAGHLTAAGADLVVNTTTESLLEQVTAATDGAGVDIALDHVGGQSFAELFAATRICGTIINIGRLAGRECTIDLDQLSFRRLRVRGTTFSVRTPEEQGEVCASAVRDLSAAVADGRVRPIVDQVFAFDDHQAAAERLRANAAVGKLVLELPEPERR